MTESHKLTRLISNDKDLNTQLDTANLSWKNATLGSSRVSLFCLLQIECVIMLQKK